MAGLSFFVVFVVLKVVVKFYELEILNFWLMVTYLLIEVIIFVVVMCILNSKLKQLGITGKMVEYWRINTEFGGFLLAVILELVVRIIEETMELQSAIVLWEPALLSTSAPLLYMMWLNHTTFRSVGRLSEEPATKRNTSLSRKSGYDALIRYSRMSLLTFESKSAVTTQKFNDSVNTSSNDSALD